MASRTGSNASTKSWLREWCQHAGVWPELDVPFLPIEKAFQEAKWAKVDDNDRPLAWFAMLTSASWVLPHPPVGLVVLYPRQKRAKPGGLLAPDDGRIEVLMWFRGMPVSGSGPRSHRVATRGDRRQGRKTRKTKFAPERKRLWERIEDALTSSSEGGEALVARYPADARTGAERLQETNWANFFYDYKVQRRKPGGSRTANRGPAFHRAPATPQMRNIVFDYINAWKNGPFRWLFQTGVENTTLNRSCRVNVNHSDPLARMLRKSPARRPFECNHSLNM